MIIAGIKRFIKKEAHNTAPFSFGKNRKHSNIRICLALATIMLCLHIVGGAATPALACGLCDLPPNFMQDTTIENYISNEHNNTQQNINNHTDKDFQSYEDWIVNDFFKQYILPAMMQMAGQMSAVAMQQMEILGTFLDAKHQMETNRLFQELAAQAHRDYQPSEGMCTIGTLSRSLEEADRTIDLTAYTLSRRSMARQLMQANSVGVGGDDDYGTDTLSRIKQFTNTYCNKTDNNGYLKNICGGVNPARINKDIDFTRTLWEPMTVPLRFSSGSGASVAEKEAAEDVIALKTNLYANRIFRMPVSAGSLNEAGDANIGKKASNLQAYLDLRSIVAKRSVAEETFDTIAGMKAAGTSDAAQTAKYIQAAIKQLNPSMSNAQAQAIVGKNPSYWAQMEVLTHKILQDPQFYTDLYDTPSNVERKKVALQAIDLVQQRDTYKVDLRSEMLWSLLLELRLEQEQQRVQKQADGMRH